MRDFQTIMTLPLSVLTCEEIAAVAVAFGAVYVEAALGHKIACEWRDGMSGQFAAAIMAGTKAGLRPDVKDEVPSWWKLLSEPDPED